MRKFLGIAVLVFAAAPAIAEGPAAGPSSQSDDAAAGKTVGVEKPLPENSEKRQEFEDPKTPAAKEPLKDTSNPAPAEPKK
jgi:hypothetical protein